MSYPYRPPMPRINPDILKWARETAGLSLEEAARRIPIRPTKKATAVERLQALESGSAEPSRATLVHMAKAYRRPLLAFYLAEPPRRGARGQDFRTLPDDRSLLDDALVDALIREVTARQNIVRDTLLGEDEAAEHTYVGSIRIGEGLEAAIARLQEILGIGRDQLRAEPNAEGAFKLLRRHAERAGIYVLLQGDLGSHHSALGTDMFRGFALADRVAPFVVVNDHDSAAAWAFTLLHEMVHLCLGDTGVSSVRGEGAIERFCNDAASAFLLADQELAALAVRGNSPVPIALELIGEFARPRNLSHTMVAYRLMRTGAISQDYWRQLHSEYRRFWFEAQAQRKAKARRTEGGPSYYVVRRHRIGEALLDFARRMVGSGALSTVRAAKVLAVRPQNVGALLSSTTPDAGQAA